MTISHAFPTVLAAAAASIVLAACGGSGSGSGDPGAGQSDDSKELAFAACLRKAGIDAPDPERGPNGEMRQRIGVPRGISPKRMGKIQKDCQKKSGFAPKPPSKAEQARFRDAALKFARCMRAHGVNIPDPQPGGGGIVIGKPSGNGKAGPNPDSPAFQRAQEACQSLMPGLKGKSGGPSLSTGGKKP
ncbi:MAG TPA: hypothetical protein VF066_02535 [Thermoleophilaceae bacterium]